MNNTKRIYYTQPQIDRLIDELICKIQYKNKPYNLVVSIANGGIYIGEKISQILNLPHISVKISWYKDQEKRNIPIIDKDFIWQPDILLADDLIDTGSTANTFLTHFGQADIAVLFWNINSQFYKLIPDYYCRIKPKEWIVFPREKNSV